MSGARFTRFMIWLDPRAGDIADSGEFRVVRHLATLDHPEALDGQRHQTCQARRAALGHWSLALLAGTRPPGSIKLELNINRSRESVTIHSRLPFPHHGTSHECPPNGSSPSLCCFFRCRRPARPVRMIRACSRELSDSHSGPNCANAARKSPSSTPLASRLSSSRRISASRPSRPPDALLEIGHAARNGLVLAANQGRQSTNSVAQLANSFCANPLEGQVRDTASPLLLGRGFTATCHDARVGANPPDLRVTTAPRSRARKRTWSRSWPSPSAAPGRKRNSDSAAGLSSCRCGSSRIAGARTGAVPSEARRICSDFDAAVPAIPAAESPAPAPRSPVRRWPSCSPS